MLSGSGDPVNILPSPSQIKCIEIVAQNLRAKNSQLLLIVVGEGEQFLTMHLCVCLNLQSSLGGVGKTTCVKLIQRNIQKAKKKCQITAYTGTQAHALKVKLPPQNVTRF